MQFNSHFIGKQKRQSIVCDSRGGLKELQGKQGSEIVLKAMVFMFTLKYGSEIVEKAMVCTAFFIRGTLEEPSRSPGEHARGIRVPWDRGLGSGMQGTGAKRSKHPLGKA